MKLLNFEYCPTCGNIIEKIEDRHVPLKCCGKSLEVLIPNSTDAAVEKHLPVFKLTETEVVIEVAEVAHPSLASHWIPWVVIQTPSQVIRYTFEAGETPTIRLPKPTTGTTLKAHAYCNLHGLWSSELTL